MTAAPQVPVPSSFRDPAGRLFDAGDALVRRVDARYAAGVRELLASSWYRELERDGHVIATEVVEGEAPEDIALTLRHPKVPFVSYAWEWPYSALKAAALLTLELQRMAAQHGFTLKDAAGTNVVFLGARPVFVDVVSFVPRVPGAPWVALGQFCRAFLFPMMIQAYRDVSPLPLLQAGLGEVGLEDTWKILGPSSLRRAGTLKWVWLQRFLERSAQDVAVGPARPGAATVSDAHAGTLLASLRRLVTRMEWNPRGSPWSRYVECAPCTQADRDDKAAFVERALHPARPRRLVDLGANTGVFSALAARHARDVIAVDMDPGAADLLQRRGMPNVWVVQANLANPSPGVGWNLAERAPLLQRIDSDFFLALALIHHLRIGAGIPVAAIVDFLAERGEAGIVEWIDRDDPMVKRLLRNREDVFADYSRQQFSALLQRRFVVQDRLALKGATRELFLVTRR